MYEHAFEYDGVLVDEPTVHYMHGGKPYRRGTRVRVQWTRESSWSSFAENIVGPSRWERTMIPGSVYMDIELFSYCHLVPIF